MSAPVTSWRLQARTWLRMAGYRADSKTCSRREGLSYDVWLAEQEGVKSKLISPALQVRASINSKARRRAKASPTVQAGARAVGLARPVPLCASPRRTAFSLRLPLAPVQLTCICMPRGAPMCETRTGGVSTLLRPRPAPSRHAHLCGSVMLVVLASCSPSSDGLLKAGEGWQTS